MNQADKFGMLYRLLNAPIFPYPYPHCYIENVFNPEWYEQLLKHFPSENLFSKLSVQTTDYRTERYNFRLIEDSLHEFTDESRSVWIELMNWMNSRDFMLELFKKFQIQISQRMRREQGDQYANNYNIYTEILMALDKTRYSLGPHTDASSKLVTLLLYFAEDDSKKHLGTSIYIPKQRDLYQLHSPHLDEKYFDLVQTLEYKPNSALMFVVSGNSFHGVKTITEEKPKRQLIQYQIMYREPANR